VLAVVIGVTGALVFGSADFAGGRAAKRSSAVGPMSTLSPLTAVVSAVMPVLGGVVRGGRLIVVGDGAIIVAVAAVAGLEAVVGLAALAAVALVSFVPAGFVHRKERVRLSLGALAMAIPRAGGRTC
jgi:hypothetical protein